MFAEHLTGKILSFDFYSKAVYFGVSFGFHDLPLVTFKTEQLDLISRKTDVFFSQV